MVAFGDYIPVKEVQRHFVDSCAINDSLVIPKGALIHVPIHYIKFNPVHWSNPNAFDPERFDSSIVAIIQKVF